MGLVAGLLTDVTLKTTPVAAAGTPIQKTFNNAGTAEDWLAPSNGVLEIIAIGGGGAGSTGGGTGGNGAMVTSWWTVTQNDSFTVRVGGNVTGSRTGGSATSIFVWDNGAKLVSVAGGGGGAGSNGGGHGANAGFAQSSGFIGVGGNGSLGTAGAPAGQGGKGGSITTGGNGGLGYIGTVAQPTSQGGTSLATPGWDGQTNASGGSGGGSNGTSGGNGGDSFLGTLGGQSTFFQEAVNNERGGGGALLAGGGAGAVNSGGGGGGYAGGGGGSTNWDSINNIYHPGAGGGAGSSFASTTKKPAGKPSPVYVTSPDSNEYGKGGDNTADGKWGRGGIVLFTFTPNPPPTPPAPKPVVKTPGKPGAFKVNKKTTAKKRKFTWRASSHATKATVYTLEIRAKGKHKVLLRKRVKATSKRAVIYTRKQLIRKSRKYQKRAKTVKLRASIYAKTGSKKSTTAHRNFNVRR